MFDSLDGIAHRTADSAVQSATSSLTAWLMGLFTPAVIGMLVAGLLLLVALVGVAAGGSFRRIGVLTALSLGIGYISWNYLPGRKAAPVVVAAPAPKPSRPWKRPEVDLSVFGEALKGAGGVIASAFDSIADYAKRRAELEALRAAEQAEKDRIAREKMEEEMARREEQRKKEEAAMARAEAKRRMRLRNQQANYEIEMWMQGGYNQVMGDYGRQIDRENAWKRSVMGGGPR